MAPPMDGIPAGRGNESLSHCYLCNQLIDVVDLGWFDGSGDV
jgi:hypothetical protein